MKSKNTFGNYEFPHWVPELVRDSIVDFWGCFDRTYKDWINNYRLGMAETCSHGPGSNGFKWPPLGATVDYIFRDYKLSEENGEDIYKIIRGRYIHAWNNIGRLIDKHGEVHYSSTCDRWVRVYVNVI